MFTLNQKGRKKKEVMKENIKILELNKYEFGTIINALNYLRDELISLNQDTNAVDEALLKALDAPVKKRSYRFREVR